jgi:hypothetical protein
MSELIDNSNKRLAVLRQMILDLHNGVAADQVKARFREQFSRVSAVEIAEMEQQLIADGLPAEEIRALCDVHVSIFQGAIETRDGTPIPPGHPVHTFQYENLAVQGLLTLLEQTMAQLPDPRALTRARIHADQLAEVGKIYTRKENLLFPFLEKHGVTGPASVMWGIQDDIRDQIKALRRALAAGDLALAQQAFPPLAQAIRQMFVKEEQVLYPTALKMLSEAEWAAIYQQSDAIGYCLVRPVSEWRPSLPAEQIPTYAHGYALPPDGQLTLDTGTLSPEQVNLMLTHLPIDITLVDENDTVLYYTEGKERIFTRTPAIIGRNVRNCHPPASVHVVTRLLDEFRQGKRDSASFWIQMGGKFVHIRYYALRDAEGRYRGTIEVTQDIMPLRALEGERRLLSEEE